MENKYSKGKIYMLQSDLTDEVYIGSTVQRLSKRKGHHKEFYMNNTKPTSACKLFDYGVNNVKIVLLEEFPCENSIQLRQREQYHLDNLRATKNVLNKYRACIDPEILRQKRRERYIKMKTEQPEKYKAMVERYVEKRRSIN